MMTDPTKAVSANRKIITQAEETVAWPSACRRDCAALSGKVLVRVAFVKV